jgi:hypothetical protein
MQVLNYDEKHVTCIFARDFNTQSATYTEFFNANDIPIKELKKK